MPPTLSQVSIWLAVTVVATNEVVPWRATVPATDFQRLGISFHDVAAAGAVDVDVHEARHDGFPS